MRDGDLTYDDFLQRLNIQDVLIDAGYHLNRRDGLRYPSYVRLDSDGRRIRGDKFIVTQQGKCCFHAQQQKVYNIISFIKEHPHFFTEYHAGMSPDRLVNLVCNRLLNIPVTERKTRIVNPKRDVKPFDIADYDIHKFNPQNRETQKKFYPYFKSRGIDLYTQYAFHRHFYLATKHREDGATYTNLSFPLTLPKGDGAIVGLEERGRARMDGSGSYKGKAAGSNSSEGLWIASPARTSLTSAKHIYWFESAYDAIKSEWERLGIHTAEQVVEYFLTDYENNPAKERRLAFYKITQAFVVAYSNISDYVYVQDIQSKKLNAFIKKQVRLLPFICE